VVLLRWQWALGFETLIPSTQYAATPQRRDAATGEGDEGTGIRFKTHGNVEQRRHTLF
jgi:hypothetical protein